MIKQSSLILILNFFFLADSLCAKTAFPRLYAFFGANAYETIVNKQFPISPEGILTIKNLDGNITVQTGHKGNTVYLKAIKKSKKQEYLSSIDIKDQVKKHHDQTHLILSTEYINKDVTGTVDYELIVPAQIKLKLDTKQGSILVKQMHGAIDATTNNGAIELIDTSSQLNAHTQKGSITISKARGPINATTKSGAITINHAQDSIIAHSDSGALTTHCSLIPHDSRLLLSSLYGSIHLSIPESTNAHVCAHTAKGILQSDVYITLKQQTLKLNKDTWKRFKQSVTGNIGTGEADIRLSSQNGSIKISEHKSM